MSMRSETDAAIIAAIRRIGTIDPESDLGKAYNALMISERRNHGLEMYNQRLRRNNHLRAAIVELLALDDIEHALELQRIAFPRAGGRYAQSVRRNYDSLVAPKFREYAAIAEAHMYDAHGHYVLKTEVDSVDECSRCKEENARIAANG